MRPTWDELRPLEAKAEREAEAAERLGQAFRHAVNCQRQPMGVRPATYPITDDVRQWAVERYQQLCGRHPLDCDCEGRGR